MGDELVMGKYKIRCGDEVHSVSEVAYKRIQRKAKREGKTLGEIWALEHGLVTVEPQMVQPKKQTIPKKETIPSTFLNLNEEDFEQDCPVNQRMFDTMLGVFFCGHHVKAKVTTTTIKRNMVNPQRCKLCVEIRREQEAERRDRLLEKAKERVNSTPPKVYYPEYYSSL